MRAKLKAGFNFLKSVFSEWSADRAPRMGAAIAYYTLFSLAPLLLIVVGVVGLVFGKEAAQGEIQSQLASTVGATTAQAVEAMVKNTSTPQGNILFTILGVVILVIGASGVFVELQDSLNEVFRVPARKEEGLWNNIRNRLLSFAMVLGIGFVLLVSLILSAALTAVANFVTPADVPGGATLWQIINALVSFGLVTLLIGLIYKILPDIELSWRDVGVGAAVTAALFTVGKYLIGLYLGQTSTTSTFGAAGSLVVMLIWVYYSAQIFILGAEFTKLYSQKVPPRLAGTHDAAPSKNGAVSEPTSAPQASPDAAAPSR